MFLRKFIFLAIVSNIAYGFEIPKWAQSENFVLGCYGTFTSTDEKNNIIFQNNSWSERFTVSIPVVGKASAYSNLNAQYSLEATQTYLKMGRSCNINRGTGDLYCEFSPERPIRSEGIWYHGFTIKNPVTNIVINGACSKLNDTTKF